MTTPDGLTPAQAYTDAVWGSRRLTAHQRIVALAYANHARGSTAWVVTARLTARTGLSRGKACDVRAELVAAGWLVPVGPHPEHAQRTVYRLAIPDESQAPAPARPQRARAASGRFERKTGPQHGPVHSTDRSTDGGQTGPQMEHEPVHSTVETGPQRGPDSLRLSEDSPHDSPRATASVRVFDTLGATPEEERILIARITTGKQIRDLGAYLARLHANGDLATMLDTLRREARAANVAAQLAELATAPPCVHDHPGGDQPHPATGQPLCPSCRRGDTGQAETAPPVQVAKPRRAKTDPAAGKCPIHPSMTGGTRPGGIPACPACRAAQLAAIRPAEPAPGQPEPAAPPPIRTAPAQRTASPLPSGANVVNLADHRRARTA